MFYKATLTFFMFLLLLAGLLFPVAPTRMDTTVIARDLRQNPPSAIGDPIHESPPAPGNR